MPLEVFHYHKAIVNTNYKLWHDTNSEFYHDYLHYFNRVTGMMQPGYFDRKYTGYPNGHASVGSMTIKYDAYEGGKERGVGWPGLAPGGWILIDIFPAMTYNLRTSVLRMDTSIPLGPNKLLIEFRGLGLKSDTPEERAERVRDHNTIWGPFGRNLHEDLLAVHGQGRAMRPGSEAHLGAPGPRGEHDDPRRGRHAALLRRMEPAHGARGVRPARRPERRDGRLGRPRANASISQARHGKRRRCSPTESRSRSSSIARASRSTRRTSRATSSFATTRFRYTITAHSPEIRKDMIWLDHDKPEMQLLFGNLPKHISDHSPLTRHAIVYTVELASDGKRPHVVSALQVFKTTLDGGATELFAIGRYLDTVKLDGEAAQAREARRPARRLVSSASAITFRSDAARFVRIQLNARNRAYHFEAEPGARILYAGLAAGINLPYECGSGTCGTCKARLVAGEIDDLLAGGRRAEIPEAGRRIPDVPVRRAQRLHDRSRELRLQHGSRRLHSRVPRRHDQRTRRR